MTSTPAIKHNRVLEVDALLETIDAVYFLLFPDWEKELRGNRWHYAVRWAQRKPLVLVNPIAAGREAGSVREKRIDNARILRVQASGRSPRPVTAQIQVAQILEDMQRNGVRRPLLWSYNPQLVDVYARTPAVARIHHATEAYFDTPGLDDAFLLRLRATAAISDLVVAVSAGVADGIRRHVPDVSVETVTNGCDFRAYSSGKPDVALRARGAGFERIAVYGGNVNFRLDFELLRRLVATHPRVLFAFYGPARGLGTEDQKMWDELRARDNVEAPGAVDPDRLPDLYAAADLGFIPYRHDRLIVDNGFPLKALEMAAAGLPVVSSSMKHLAGVAQAVIVAPSSDAFMSAFAKASRANLGEHEAKELRDVSAENDYDLKFGEVLALAKRHVHANGPRTRIDALTAVLGDDSRTDAIELGRWLLAAIRRKAPRRLVDEARKRVPASWKRRLRGQ